jgi:UDP-N-acetyl-D-galactosamine dehydrogenase
MKEQKIAILGLGYVGLPLAAAFSKHFPVIGFDINADRIEELSHGFDRTKEITNEELSETLHYGISFTNDENHLAACTIYIVTVPTPIDAENSPNLKPLLSATETIGKFLKKNDIVIYESTTYPGCTEEDCVPVLEKISGLSFNRDFYCGYSPERINPGDKINTLTKIKKVTSGSTPEIAVFVDELYKKIITAGTHLASSIKIAEASKAIENAQRDLNISFINELALIFDRMKIDTNEVLEAASTKWNFLKFTPGLVGGHCISVDPYYLSYKAEQLGYHPAVILSGRRVNDSMAKFVATKVINLLLEKGNYVKGSKALILGITFKENCPDIRNSKIPQVMMELEQNGIETDIHDPLADTALVEHEYGLKLATAIPEDKKYDAIILAVAHVQFRKLNPRALLATDEKGIVYDLKNFIPRDQVDGRL